LEYETKRFRFEKSMKEFSIKNGFFDPHQVIPNKVSPDLHIKLFQTRQFSFKKRTLEKFFESKIFS